MANEMKHTSGPWQRSGVRRKLGCEDCLQVGPDGVPIIFLPIGKTPNEHAGAIADANLIAAAPDLLAVAIRAKAWIESAMQDKGWPEERIENPPKGSHLDAINAAIAKATGA